MDNQDISKKQLEDYRMYQVLLELLQARGYTIGEEKDNLTLQEFQSKKRDLEEDFFFKDEEDGETIMAVKCNFSKKRITQEMIEDFMKNMAMQGGKLNPSYFFIVAGTNPKNNAIDIDKAAQTFQKLKDDLKVEFFHDENLKFNILKHELVPQHILLSQSEKDNLMKYYKVKLSQLPKILHTDPVAKFLGLKRNQVVKIVRKSQTAGVYTTYRVVV